LDWEAKTKQYVPSPASLFHVQSNDAKTQST